MNTTQVITDPNRLLPPCHVAYGTFNCHAKIAILAAGTAANFSHNLFPEIRPVIIKKGLLTRMEEADKAWSLVQKEKQEKKEHIQYLAACRKHKAAAALEEARQWGFKTAADFEMFCKKQDAKRVKIDAKLAIKDAAKQAKAAARRQKAAIKAAAAAKVKQIKALRKAAGNPDAIVYKVEWLDYENGNGQAYRGNRSARWGRTTQCHAITRTLITTDVVMTEGSSVYVNGNRKIKCNLTNYATGESIRADYNL